LAGLEERLAQRQAPFDNHQEQLLQARWRRLIAVLTLLNEQTRDLSCERESSEQFVWLNRRYGERETQLSRSAIMPSIRADSSQNEVI
jgi:hypothetical protein